MFIFTVGITLCAIVLLAGASLVVRKPASWDDTDTALIVFNGGSVTAQVAASPLKKERGLSGVSSLPEKTGMLFVFSISYRMPFWMKGMLIPLDFVWLKKGTVVDIAKSVPAPAPGEKPRVVAPSVAADMVLEVPAGTVAEMNIRIGDTPTIDKQ